MGETLCECGCGNPAPIATVTSRAYGWVKGQPKRFIRFHHDYNRGAGNITHGHTVGRTGTRHKDSPTYKSWQAMIYRCTNPKSDRYKNYGGKGVTVCDRWMTFENFLADMGERPEGTTNGRFKDEGNYEPTNCKWMTRAEQEANRHKAA